MADPTIPTSVLSDAISGALAGRSVRAGVFTTFSFEPAFFEEQILPVLFEQSFSHMDNVRLLQLEEALPAVQPLAVYYDRAALAPDSTARLDVRRIGITRRTGCFHPKIVALLVENTDGKQGDRSLVLAVLSANLTRAGWWENVECAETLEVRAGQRCSFRDDLIELLRSIRRSAPLDEPHVALTSILQFLRNEVEASQHRSAGGVLHPQLFAGQTTLADFLTNVGLERGTFHLEVISPYFDERKETLAALIDALQPRSTTVFLPMRADSGAACSAQLFEDVASLPRTAWGALPSVLLRRRTDGDEGDVARFVHAKVYRLWSKEREVLLTGSPNLTDAAHSAVRAGNLEAAILVERRDPSERRQRWLRPLQESETPAAFGVESCEDAVQDVEPPPVTIVFDWASSTARYVWERVGKASPGRAELFSSGVSIGTIGPVMLGESTPLGQDLAAALEARLPSTSLVGISVDQGPRATVLVLEENMAHKPSLRGQLTAAEILHYWSLLSVEQRQAFLDARIARLLAAQGVAAVPSTPLGATPSLFDGFAGIFHAFARLEAHVAAAIEGQRPAEAVYRLFGRRFDSLPSLIERVLDEDQSDPVRSYVTLLSARQLLRRIRSRSDGHASFLDQHVEHERQLNGLLDRIADVRGRFDFDGPDERRRFFEWFDRRFLADAKRPVEVA